MLTNNPSLRNKNLRASLKDAHVELFRGDARLVPRYAMTGDLWKPRTNDAGKIFRPPKKKARLKNSFILTTFEKLFIIQCRMCYAIYIPLNTKDLTIDLTSNEFRTNKQFRFVEKYLIETRLYTSICLHNTCKHIEILPALNLLNAFFC